MRRLSRVVAMEEAGGEERERGCRFAQVRRKKERSREGLGEAPSVEGDVCRVQEEHNDSPHEQLRRGKGMAGEERERSR